MTNSQKIRYLTSQISNIDFGKTLGTIEFSFKGTKQTIREPEDIILVCNTPRLQQESKIWIAEHYQQILTELDDQAGHSY